MGVGIKQGQRESASDVRARFIIAQSSPRPSDEQLTVQLELAEQITSVAVELNELVEDSPAKSTALAKLEEALMWAGKAIFR